MSRTSPEIIRTEKWRVEYFSNTKKPLLVTGSREFDTREEAQADIDATKTCRCGLVHVITLEEKVEMTNVKENW